VAAIFGAMIWTRLAKRIGKSKALIVACVTYAVVQFAVVTLPAGNFWLAAPFLIAAGIPYSAGALLLRSMMADYGDEERLALGRRPHRPAVRHPDGHGEDRFGAWP
jgi:GPH family glycoside/pentoside/hexuronide:cation symporter